MDQHLSSLSSSPKGKILLLGPWSKWCSQHLHSPNTLYINGKLSYTHSFYLKKKKTTFLQSRKLFPLSKSDGLFYSVKKINEQMEYKPIIH